MHMQFTVSMLKFCTDRLVSSKTFNNCRQLTVPLHSEIFLSFRLSDHSSKLPDVAAKAILSAGDGSI